MKKLFKTQMGRFAAGVLALLLAVGVNLAARPVGALRADVTQQKVMTPSAQTLEELKKVGQNVEILYLATDEEKELWVDELAARYAEAAAHVTYRLIAPDGGEAEKLSSLAGGALEAGSLAVISGDRCAVIEPSELYEVTYNQLYYAYYGQQVAETTTFEADNLLLNALLYVTSDELPVVYELMGHGETGISVRMSRQMQKDNILLRTLDLSDGMPGDAAAIVICGPKEDLSTEESEQLLSYLKKGGKLLLMTEYDTPHLPNLEAVTAYYGMEPVSGGCVMDAGNGANLSSEYPHYIFPQMANHSITAELNESSARVMLPLCGGMKRNSIRRSGMNVGALLTTSEEESYLKSLDEQTSTLAREENDLPGPFTVAMAAEEGEARVVWYASVSFLSDEVMENVSTNGILLEDTLDWMLGGLKERALIESENLLTSSLLLPTGTAPLMIAAAFVPALIALVIGLIRRRRPAE